MRELNRSMLSTSLDVYLLLFPIEYACVTASGDMVTSSAPELLMC